MTLNCLVVSFIVLVHSKDLRAVIFHGTTSIYYLVISILACSRLSDSGEDAKEKGTRKGSEGGPLPSHLSSRFIFVFILSQFSGPDYLGAWNRLLIYQCCGYNWYSMRGRILLDLFVWHTIRQFSAHNALQEPYLLPAKKTQHGRRG